MTAEQARQLADSPELKERILFKRRIKDIYQYIENTILQGRTNYIIINLNDSEIKQLERDKYIVRSSARSSECRVSW